MSKAFWQYLNVATFCSASNIVSLERSSNCNDPLVFSLTMDVLGQNYTLEGLVRSTSHYFTEAIKAENQWVCIRDKCIF